MNRAAACADCGLEYGGPAWIEAVIPDKIWDRISPTGDGGGLLCVSCMARRLNALGVRGVPVWFCGMEPLSPMMGDPADALPILRKCDIDDLPRNLTSLEADDA